MKMKPSGVANGSSNRNSKNNPARYQVPESRNPKLVTIHNTGLS